MKLAILTFLVVIVGCYHLYKYARPVITNKDYLRENVERLKRVSEFLNNTAYVSPETASIVLAIISVERTYGDINLNYLTQVIGSFIFMMQSEGITDVRIFLCDASGAGKGVDNTIRSLLGVTNVKSYVNPGSYGVEKELFDYISCLEELSQSHADAKYFILNEDDGVPEEDFFANVVQIAKQIDRYILRTGKDDISHVKLFHPLRLRKLPFLIYIFAVPVLVVGVVRLSAECLPVSLGWVWLGVIFVSLSLLVFALGPNTVGIIHHKVLLGYMPLLPPESCCTVSVLYPQSTLNKTVQYLQDSALENHRLADIHAKDSILDNLPWKTNMRTLMTEFNLVKHIGMYTTLRSRPLDVTVVKKR